MLSLVAKRTPASVVLLVVLIALAACRITRGDNEGIEFLCTTECPDGQLCMGGECVGPGSDSGPDAPIDSGPDASACTCEAVAFADDCGAAVVDLISGERVCASTELNTNAVLGCTGNPMPAADAAYRIAAAAGQMLTATVRPTGFDAALYVTRDCSGTCVEIVNDVGISGTESLSVSITVAGDYFLVVDSPSGVGCYELDVMLQ